MSRIVERFLNAEMHCFVKRMLDISFRLCCFRRGVQKVADVASVTQKKKKKNRRRVRGVWAYRYDG